MASAGKPTEAVALPTTTISAADSDDHGNERAVELEERLVAEQFILRRHALLEKKLRFQQLEINNQKTNALGGAGGEKPDLRPMSVSPMLNAAAPDCEETNKLPERGIHSLTHSVTDELSRPISEVEDDPHFDPNEVSSESCAQASPLSRRQMVGRDPTEGEGHNLMQGSVEVDDFEGVDGEIDSESGEKSQKSHLEELTGRTLSPNGRPREGSEEHENEDGEIFQASEELPNDQQSTEMKLYSLSGQQYSPQPDSEEFSSNQNNLEEKKMVSSDAEVDDADSNLGTFSAEPRTQDEEPSEISLFYPQQLDPEDIINPFSLEVRIRKAREQQHISLEWEAETIAENRADISQPPVNLEGTKGRSFLPVFEKISPDEPTGSSDRAVEIGFHSQVKERTRTGSAPGDLVDDAKELSEKKPGVGEAVLLGALASGVNRPTWFVIRAVLVALVGSLLLLLYVAIKSDTVVLLNVLIFISIAGGLIILLGWYISETGFVSVDKQMAELNLISEPQKVTSKTL